MYGYWLGMSFIWWVVWVAIIVMFFAFLTPVRRGSARPSNDPLDILRRRYAAGEITTAEYEERRARLLDAVPRSSATEGARRTSAVVPPTPPPEHRTQH